MITSYFVVLIFVCHMGIVPTCTQVQEPLMRMYPTREACLDVAKHMARNMEQATNPKALQGLPPKPWNVDIGCWTSDRKHVVMG
jgi:hypothetical protein